jgi:hypothetical protein
VTEETQERHLLCFSHDPLDPNIAVLRDLRQEQDVVRIDIEHPMGPLIAYALLDIIYDKAARVIGAPPAEVRH